MANTHFSLNSIWPNGIKKDSDGYAVFYPLGTNKVDISTITWPEGNKLISPFVYQDDKLVGFFDTKALIHESDTITTTLPYDEINVDFSSIERGKLIIHPSNSLEPIIKWAKELPDNYTEIDYLESTGTQFIHTPHLDWNDVGVEYDFYVVNPKENTNIPWYGLFGGQFVNNGGWWVPTYLLWKTSGTGTPMSAMIHGGKKTFNFEPLTDERRTITMTDSFVKINNNIFHIWEDSTTQKPVPNNFRCILFGINNGQWENEGARYLASNAKIYNFRLFKNNENILKFIPALDPTGAPCMYDVISKIPYYNESTGDFQYPSNSTVYSLRNQITPSKYALKTPNGIRRLYHVPQGYAGSIEEYAVENNYKFLIESECPNEKGKNYIIQWKETETELIAEWVEREINFEL